MVLYNRDRLLPSSQVRTYWLSFQAAYACQHRGACCSSGWDIPVERWRIEPIRQAIATGRIAAPARWVRSADGAPDEIGGVLNFADDGRHCIFYRAPGCAVQSALGHGAMPSACRHFPRIVLIDGRGIFVTLSHYCPTAARLLFDGHEHVTIVEGPPVLPGGELPEGLDARSALPPSESPRRLMTLEGYSAWERQALSVLTTAATPDRALATLDPGAHAPSEERLLDIARAAVPPPHAWRPAAPAVAALPPKVTPVIARYLSAHVFASWTAYQGSGLRVTVLYLRTALAVLRAELGRAPSLFEAIRQADLLLRHLVDRQALATELSRQAR